VRPPASSPGSLRIGDEADWPTIATWAEPFKRATNAHVDVTAFLRRRLRSRHLFVWDFDGPKCMIVLSSRTPNVVSISTVFTPDEHRGRGYASNAIAAASQNALDAGRASCIVFTERDPAGPIRLYERVGFRVLRDHVLVDLV
jgi:uncharacterized protein